jgi:hypothetical protein
MREMPRCLYVYADGLGRVAKAKLMILEFSDAPTESVAFEMIGRGRLGHY